jgi:DNA-binding PadR family transcriptional regulator
MHKKLLLLGFLRERPLTGYEINRLLSAHGGLYSDLKRGNVYYLLERLAHEGLVSVKTEPGARGPRGERLIYSLSALGKREIADLVRKEIEDYEPLHAGIEVAVVLLDEVPKSEALALMRKRLVAVDEATGKLRASLGAAGTLPGSAGDHMLSLAEAERLWLVRLIEVLESARKPRSSPPAH